MTNKITTDDKKAVSKILRAYQGTTSVQEKIKLADELEQKVTEIKTR